MFHSVNCGDHYAYVDRRVDQLNYLRYSDAQWQRWNNVLYQNRLRAHVFVERAREAGFVIELDTAKASERRLRELAATPVHAQFAAIAPERLCITSVDFIARKPTGERLPGATPCSEARSVHHQRPRRPRASPAGSPGSPCPACWPHSPLRPHGPRPIRP